MFPNLTALALSAALIALCALLAACYHKFPAAFGRRKVRTTIVGITGTIASGKSLLGKLLEDEGVPVLDTDHIAHFLQAKDKDLRLKLKERFGAEIFNEDGSLNRKKLGSLVFSNERALRDLNELMHPAIIRECRKRIAELQDKPLVAVLVPLLFEAGLENEYDEIWCVHASDEVVLERLQSREGISREEALKRIRSQYPQAKKIARSNRAIDNSGSVEETKAQLALILSQVLLQNRAGH